MIGKVVSHYKIFEHLGGGGMGVVYKAEDTRLKRIVALKFLPPSLTTDPDAKERFIHEAQAASALQHNNICTVHDIDQTEDGQVFIVMDLYEGETLKKKIEHGALEFHDAIGIAIQIAEGLAEAHAHGIIHRDIKPANVLVTKGGVAKVVDFGLAKLAGRSLLTRSGTTLGTVAYMSPEQARGEPVDHRTDLWSLGVMLYEMLAGKRPFASDYEQALVYAILNEEPKPIRELRKNLPENISLIIRQLLAKDPAERYPSADDVLSDLLAAQGGASVNVKMSRPIRKSTRKLPTPWKYIGAACFLVICATTVVVLISRVPRIKLNPNVQSRTIVSQVFTVPSFNGTVPPNCSPGLSGDGNWITYSLPDGSEYWNWDIYFRNVAWSEPRRLEVKADLFYGAVSLTPAGDRVVLSEHALLRTISVISTSGGAKKLIEDSTRTGGYLSSDGSRIAYVRPQTKPFGLPLEVWSGKIDGTDKHCEFVDTAAANIYALSWSPDGRSMAIARELRDGAVELFTRDLATGNERQLTYDRKYVDEPWWLSNGIIVFVSSRSGKTNIWAIPETGGEQVPVISGGTEHLNFKASADGKRFLMPEFEAFTTEIRIANLSSGGAESTKLHEPAIGSGFVLNPDFSRVLCVVRDLSANTQSIVDVGHTGRRLVASGTLSDRYSCGSWSPDGRWSTYCSRETGNKTSKLFVVEASNPENSREICENPIAWAWADSLSLLVYTEDARMRKLSIVNPHPEPFFEDSTFARPVSGTRYIVYWNFRSGRDGWWLTHVNANGKATGRARQILRFEDCVLSPDCHVILYEKKPGEIWRLRLPDCGEEFVRKASSLPQFSWGTTDSEGKKLAYVVQTTAMRLILYENLFE